MPKGKKQGAKQAKAAVAARQQAAVAAAANAQKDEVEVEERDGGVVVVKDENGIVGARKVNGTNITTMTSKTNMNGTAPTPNHNQSQSQNQNQKTTYKSSRGKTFSEHVHVDHTNNNGNHGPTTMVPVSHSSTSTIYMNKALTGGGLGGLQERLMGMLTKGEDHVPIQPQERRQGVEKGQGQGQGHGQPQTRTQAQSQAVPNSKSTPPSAPTFNPVLTQPPNPTPNQNQNQNSAPMVKKNPYPNYNDPLQQLSAKNPTVESLSINSYPNYPYPPTSVTSLHQPGFLAPPTAPASSAHGLGLGPTLVVLDDPSHKYLQAQQSFYATHPPTHKVAASSIPDVPPPLPVSLPRLPCIPPLVVHQEQLYFDDGLGAPGKCPHGRKWGEIGKEHKEARGLGLSDVEMDDFMVDLGDLVSKEYDAWIERCW